MNERLEIASTILAGMVLDRDYHEPVHTRVHEALYIADQLIAASNVEPRNTTEVDYWGRFIQHPIMGSEYWSIQGDYRVFSSTWLAHPWDLENFQRGEAFVDQASAQKALEVKNAKLSSTEDKDNDIPF